MSQTPPPEDPKSSKDRRPPWWAFAVLLGAATLILVFFGWSVGSWELLLFEVLLGMAAFSVGGLLGFLFGIPKTLTREAPEGSTAVVVTGSPSGSDGQAQAGTGLSYRPSNNLEQVSDWLTKIIIGVGLVEFKQIGDALSTTGGLVQKEIARGEPTLLGAGILTQVVIVVFVVLGFLISFLWTRLYYGLIQRSADDNLLQNVANATAQLLDGSLVRPQAPITGSRSARSAAREAVSTDQEWSQELRDKVEKLVTAPVEWNSDPVGFLFGRTPSEDKGRKLTAEITSQLPGALVLSLQVDRLAGEPLQGEVSFLLHPTFPKRIETRTAEHNRAQISISAGGRFTVAAIADEGRTVLAYDLLNLPNAPDWFKNS